MRLPLEVAVGGGTMIVGASCALLDIGLSARRLENLLPDFWVRLTFIGLLILVVAGCAVLFTCSRLSRAIVSLAVAAETALLLSSVSTNANAAFNSLSAKLVFIQILGLSALWLPHAHEWLHKKGAGPAAVDPRR